MDAGLVLLPRPTTLVGAANFTTAPLDLSRLGSATFQVWRGPIRVASGSGSFTVFLEESQDCQTWCLGAGSSLGIVIPEDNPKFVSYDMRLRWLRVRFALAGTDPMVSCWAEGGAGGGGPEVLTHSGAADETSGLRPCVSKGTVRETFYTNETYEVPAGAAYRGKPTGMGYSDGRRWWTWAPPGYDVIDKWGKLTPWCPPGSPTKGYKPTLPGPLSESEVLAMYGTLTPPTHPTGKSILPDESGYVIGANSGAGAGGLAVRSGAGQPLDWDVGP